MRIEINAPAIRPLSPNEQKVYSLLRLGFEPKEIAEQIKMPLSCSWKSNSHDVSPDTVLGIIADIRAKGHDIPDFNEEDDNMKYTAKQKQKALKLFDEGMSPPEIARRLKINYKSVSRWTCDYKKQKTEAEAEMWSQAFEDSKVDAMIEEGKLPCEVTPDTDMEEYEKAWAEKLAKEDDDFDPCEMMLAETPPVVVNADTDIEALEKAWEEYETKKEEPAQAVTCTDSKEESFGKESTDIIPENLPAVKSRYFSVDTVTAIEDKIAVLSAEQNKITGRMLKKYAAIDKINASIAEDDALNCGIQFRIDELKADLKIIRGGVVSE